MQRLNERGATIAEFAFVAGLFFTLTFFLFDVGMVLHKQIILNDAVNVGVRQATALSPVLRSCNPVLDESKRIATEKMELAYPGSAAQIIFEAGTQGLATSTRNSSEMLLTLQASWPVHCVVCSFLPQTLQLRSNSRMLLERSCS